MYIFIHTLCKQYNFSLFCYANFLDEGKRDLTCDFANPNQCGYRDMSPTYTRWLRKYIDTTGLC